MKTETRTRFDDLITEPLGSTSTLRRQVVAHHRALGDDASAVMARAGAGLVHMLDELPRKTSPLHQRMIHALAQVFLESGAEGDGDGIVELLDELADMIRRPDLRVGR